MENPEKVTELYRFNKAFIITCKCKGYTLYLSAHEEYEEAGNLFHLSYLWSYQRSASAMFDSVEGAKETFYENIESLKEHIEYPRKVYLIEDVKIEEMNLRPVETLNINMKT